MENVSENPVQTELAPPAISTAEQPMSQIKHGFKFYGKGGEYFRIWIVNLSLTILTLGIYSAWAKVRNMNYVYNNLEVMGSRFHFHASAINILKGRLIVAGLFIAYLATTHFFPILSALFSLVFIFVTPWLIVRSLQFTARNTSFRGVRFNFKGSHGAALSNFILLPIGAFLTLGLLTPYMFHQQQKYIVDNAYYGQQKFRFEDNVSAFYWLCFKAFIALAIGGAVVTGLISVVSDAVTVLLPASAGPDFINGVLAAVSVGLMFVYMLLVQSYFNVLLINARYCQSHLLDSGFESRLSVLGLGWIYISNMVLIIGSLGLAIPWTTMRLMNYRANALSVLEGSQFSNIVAESIEHQSAFGEEVGDALDVDFAL